MIKNHCCKTMENTLNYVCKQHKNPFDCPDHLIYYSLVFDEYGIIIHDGGPSYSAIYFCPYCGSKLSDSKRDLWFDALEALGFAAPFEQNIPEDFNSDRWYNKQD
ncbi:hypothetical protein J2Z48_003162 [Croceifilum oryzae]|uniref:DUF6980 domain-containing protein n=1 Tax=Croceifilum oryzae TaxID=1553429 RepID=A0AAJ1TL93_9BACL|nr:hypothetical protein [Croceifilum oryzae]MDQ0418957.1 hypothetical protein [Croceifilum oryzae]